MSKVEYGSPLPRSVSVRGLEIKRAPLGRTLIAMERLQSIAADLIKMVFPGDLLKAFLMGQYQPTMETWAGAFLVQGPNFVIDLTADLTGIDREKLITSDELGLDGLIEVLDAWLEVNNIANFTQAIRGIVASAKGIDTGSTDSSRSDSDAGSANVNCLRTTTLTKLVGSFRNTLKSSTPTVNTMAAASTV